MAMFRKGGNRVTEWDDERRERDARLDIVGFEHVGLTVEDLDRSLRFYSDLLGFDVVSIRESSAQYLRDIVGYPTVTMRVALLKLPVGTLSLELLEYCNVDRQHVRLRNGDPGSSHIAFKVRAIREAVDALMENDVDVLSPPVLITEGPNRGRKAVYAVDPDGYRIELVEDGTLVQ